MSFSLKQIKTTKDPTAPARLTLYAEHKQGKSTFASQSNKPIFIPTEDGLSAIEVDAFPLCKSWDDTMECVSSLYSDDHDYKTVVLDSADWAERLVQAHVAKANGVDAIERIGYGKGFLEAADRFADLLSGLNALRTEKGMDVIILCHCQIRRFDDPMAESYDRYELKLQKHIAKLVMEWSDVLAFAQIETITKTGKGDGFKAERNRAITTGRRMMHLQKSPAFDAGNRFGLPDVIPLDWSTYEEAMKEARS